VVVEVLVVDIMQEVTLVVLPLLIQFQQTVVEVALV
jgi:hypothetical protein